jgi:YidC/Oxa1 family membrane protein insertase
MNVDFVPVAGDEGLTVAPYSSTRIRHDLRLTVPAPRAETRVAFGLYIGPKSYRAFATLPEDLRERFTPILEHDLASPCCFGVTMPGGRPMAKLLLWLLGIFHDVIGNWGLAIMMLTILVRGLLAPVNFRMQKSMRAYGKKMAVLKPKLDALKAQFGSDQRGYQQAMIAFQREHKMMPPLGGCLPIFLTMPIYIGLFTALRTAYDVRQEPFFAWIVDLSRPDALVHDFLFGYDLNVLPIVWIVMMVFQTLRTPLPNDPQQRQTMMIMRFMPLLFGVMLYSYAAALLVYMVTSMVWSMIEFSITRKILGPIDAEAAAFAPQAM